jgi:hypothetical protein
MVRQNIHIRRVILILLVLSGCQVATAQNLVPNSGFEEFDDCPDLPGQIGEAIGWFNVGGGCDYYNVCGSNGFSIPVNYSGGGYARTGDAYAQISVYAVPIINGREFAGVELTESLQANVNYRIEFYLSMMDSLNYAVRNVGAHLSAQPHPQNLMMLLSLEPQVSYNEDAFLDDKIGWMLISGTFTAQGGERYLAIGNFDDDANTDTISVPNGGNPNGNPPGYWDAAGYFIDDVSVVPDSIYLSNEELGIRNDELRVWPNPASDVVNLDFSALHAPLGMTIRVVDVLGRDVLEKILTSPNPSLQGGELLQWNVSQWPEGIYLITVTDEDGNRGVERLVVQ